MSSTRVCCRGLPNDLLTLYRQMHQIAPAARSAHQQAKAQIECSKASVQSHESAPKRFHRAQ